MVPTPVCGDKPTPADQLPTSEKSREEKSREENRHTKSTSHSNQSVCVCVRQRTSLQASNDLLYYRVANSLTRLHCKERFSHQLPIPIPTGRLQIRKRTTERHTTWRNKRKVRQTHTEWDDDDRPRRRAQVAAAGADLIDRRDELRCAGVQRSAYTIASCTCDCRYHFIGVLPSC